MSTRRRPRPRWCAAGVLLVLAAGALALERSAAGAATAPSKGGIRVVQVEGLLDPPNVSLVRNAIRNANQDHRSLLVLQVDSPGAVTDVGDVVRAVGRSRVPIVAWVGPSGAQAQGGAALLVEAAHRAFVAQGADLGPASPVRLDEPDASSVRATQAALAALAGARGRDPRGAADLATEMLSPQAAARAGATNGVRPTLGEVIVTLDGETVRTAAGTTELSTARVVGEGRDRRRQPNQEVVFEGLSLAAQLQHALISPATAYFLLVVGLGLIAFEFFAASIGFAAAVGALALVGGCYGFSHLPVHWWAVGLLVASVLAFSVDAQAGGFGFWTGLGIVTLVVGSLTLYGGDSTLRPAWWILALVILSDVTFELFAVPTFIRARFSTPTIGRESMVGEMGTAEVRVDPDGVVLIRDARWRARTNRATPIGPGDPVRVVSVEGLVLEVEPETGGARDHRERGRRRRGTEPDSDAS